MHTHVWPLQGQPPVELLKGLSGSYEGEDFLLLPPFLIGQEEDRWGRDGSVGKARAVQA